ncbi:N-methylhydantoinase A/oxoprolinase/acetone carboxylase beta subunit [Bradyrhizobium sp. LB9.1b]
MLEGAEVRLAVDIGGTFTDIVLDVGQDRKTRKLLTTPQRPEQAVLDGMRLILADARAHISDIDVFIHGTTLATNAIIERRGAKAALIATDGFRDVLDIGTESRYDQYDLSIDKPKPLAPRSLRFTVPERIDAHGAVRLPLDEAAVRALAPRLRALKGRECRDRVAALLRQPRARAPHGCDHQRGDARYFRDRIVRGVSGDPRI